MRAKQWILVLLVVVTRKACADIYLHNPRGSNNRLNEDSRERNNANRLFDSQNNNRGGYNVGSVYFYTDSKLGIEWTNQHSCADQNNHCEIIIQYMCSDLLRDGITEATIPENPSECEKMDCNSDREYGMHEDFYYYAHCKLRTRNKGLFTADKRLNGESAKYTRQNPQGTRRGYECPEERDYYPYWGPTPWKDIAVLTNNVSRCDYYQSESQNVKSKWACEIPYQYLYTTKEKDVEDYIPISKEKCEAFDATLEDGTIKPGVWKEYPSHNLDAPVCANSISSRDNHLGNTLGGNPATFNWTVFDDPNQSCAIRIRYNISTADFDGWSTTSESNNRGANADSGPAIWSIFGLSETDGKARGYQLKQNPQVEIFDNFQLQLAINTAQFGRTFQDRTHRVAIRERPSELQDERIVNINVRGKRGNIVQVYPGVEYDFVPNTARVAVGDYIHYQWTGSNNNPNNNDGEGTEKTDRSNVVPMRYRNFPEGDPTKAQSYTYGSAGVSYPSNTSADFLGFDVERISMLASLYNSQFGGIMETLDDAGTYYDIGPQKVTMAGDFNYMCTRNNNFSNRSQKGKIVVRKSRVEQDYVGELGGNVTITGTESPSQTMVSIPPGSLSAAQIIQLEVYDDDEIPLESEPPNTDYISDFVLLSHNVQASEEDKLISMTIALKSGAAVGSLFEPTVYRTVDGSSWLTIDIDEYDSSAVHFKTDSGGYFVVSKSVAAGPMAGLVIGCIAAVALIVGLAIYCRTTKMPLASYSSKV